jgi:hypothetical protein
MVALFVLAVYYSAQTEAQEPAPKTILKPEILTKVGDYGAILSRDNDAIKNAIVEKIVLYSQEHENSPATIERNGFLVRYKNAIGTVVMCHGFMCDKHDQAFLRRIFPKGRYNVLTFDFRAHGDNTEGQICTLGHEEALDVTAAAQFAKNHPALKNKPIYAYGFSMGAVAAIEAQAKDSSLFQAMVLDCPFDSSENVVKKGLDNLKISFLGYSFDIPGKTVLQKYAFHPYIQTMVKAVLKAVAKMDSKDITLHAIPVKPVQSIAKISVPSFFIHCKNDQRVSVAAVRSIYDNSGAAYKMLWLTNGRGHFDSYFYSPELYTYRVRNFLDTVVRDTKVKKKAQEVIEDKEEAILG